MKRYKIGDVLPCPYDYTNSYGTITKGELIQIVVPTEQGTVCNGHTIQSLVSGLKICNVWL